MTDVRGEAIISDTSSCDDSIDYRRRGPSEVHSEDDDDEVPIVDYHVVEAADVRRVLSAEEATAVKITKDKLLIGTEKGSVYAFDGHGKMVGTWMNHKGAVTCIDTDYSERYVASSSQDASVCVVSLKVAGGRITADLDLSINSRDQPALVTRSVRAVAIHPLYASGHRSVVFGGEDYKLVLTKRGTVFNNNSILHSGEGTITNIKWMNNMIAWTNLKGMKIYDISSKHKVTFLPRPVLSDSIDSHAAALSAQISWLTEELIALSWGPVVRVCRLMATRVDSPGRTGKGTVVRYGQVIGAFSFTSDITVTGIGLFDKGDGIPNDSDDFTSSTQLSILTCPVEGIKLAQDTSSPRDLSDSLVHHVVNLKGEASFSDRVPISASDVTARWILPSETGLAFSPPHSSSEKALTRSRQTLAFVTTPIEFVMVTRRSLLDHAMWLIAKRKFEESVQVASAMDSTEAVGTILSSAMQPLLSDKEYHRAATLTSLIDSEKYGSIWTSIASEFESHNALQYLVGYLPVDVKIAEECGLLDAEIYDKTITSVILHRPSRLLPLLQRWPRELYSETRLVKLIGEVIPEYWTVNWSTQHSPPPEETGTSAEDDEADRESDDDDDEMKVDPSREREHYVPLLLALRYLYARSSDLGNLLAVDLRLGDTAAIFNIISDPSKVQSSTAVRQWVARHLLTLFRTNPLATCAVLSDNMALFPVGSVVVTLDGESKLLHCYLKYLLITKGQPAVCMPYLNRMVDLFMEFEPESLIKLLREIVNLGCNFDTASHPSGSYVDLKKVLQKCNAHPQTNHCLRESRAFLLWHLGRTQEALSVLLDESFGDLALAVDFIAPLKDVGLWRRVVDFALEHPGLLPQLIHAVEYHIENEGIDTVPVEARSAQILRRVPQDFLGWHELAGNVVSALSRCELEVTLLSSDKDLLRAELGTLSDKSRRRALGGVSVLYDQNASRCSICKRLLRERVEALSPERSPEEGSLATDDHECPTDSGALCVDVDGRLAHAVCAGETEEFEDS
ncbi:Vacuolar protein sorting-associated protein 41 [Perkinsus olseni]|uniref:Vacuolar protein sorting-associated protein 41 n=1 Tax=Perkinsus olseni TaxID=32597 RepID=A0A7J6PN08_PEROL|nr:Vacuolar protein sorting-associated protein 41 [Perkinsus olseni]